MSPLKRIIAIGAVGLAVVLLGTWVLTVTAGYKKASPPTSNTLADLERRISNLESIQEPFVVVDRQGKKIFSVGATGYNSYATVFNSNEVGVATMGATTDGGYFSVRNDDGSRSAELRIDQTWAGLRINERVTEPVTEQGVTRQVTRVAARVELGRKEAGNYSLTFPAKSGQPIAGIGESKAGTGALIIGDTQGSKRASMTVGDGKGVIAVFNGAGNAVVALGEAVGNGGGELAIGDANSKPRVKMGTKDNRYGVVLTFPLGLPYVPKSGLPGTFMLGCAGGPSCVP